VADERDISILTISGLFLRDEKWTKNTITQLSCITCIIGALASDFAATGIVGDLSVSSTKRRITRSIETEDAL